MGHKTRSEAKATRLEIRPVATLGREGGEVPKYPLLLRLENLGAHVQHTTTHTMVSAAHTLISRSNWLRMLVTNLNTTSTSTLYYYYSRRKL